jgi:uncharacterized tellurite resistance protein B-like protein
MTASLALKETAAIYQGALKPLEVGDLADYAANVRRAIDAAERLVRSRKIKAISERAKVSEAFAGLLAGGLPAEVKEQLDKTILAVSNQITEQAEAIEHVQRDSDELLKKVRTLSPENFKVARKEISRFIECGKEMHSDIVDMYYFLLSLKSELDPEIHIGPSFDNPDELKAFLDAELAN